MKQREFDYYRNFGNSNFDYDGKYLIYEITYYQETIICLLLIQIEVFRANHMG